MYYEEYGKRELPTIIMLHGAGLPHCFVNQYILSDRYHLIIPHLYGNGREARNTYTSKKTLNSVYEIIKNLGKDKVNIIGFSLGAQLIIPLICEYEQLFDKAIMASPWVCKSEKFIKSFSRLASLTYPLAKSKFLIKLQSKLIGLNSNQLHQSIEYYKNTQKENIVAFITDGINIYDYPSYKNVKIPMLALSGVKESPDMIKSVKYLGEINSNCKVELWNNYHHDIPFKNPSKFNKVIIDFLNPIEQTNKMKI